MFGFCSHICMYICIYIYICAAVSRVDGPLPHGMGGGRGGATWMQNVPDIRTYMPTYMPTYIPTDIPRYRPTLLLTYMPDRHTCLPSYLPTCILAFLHSCIHTYHTYHTIPYRTVHTIPYHTIPYHTIPYHTQGGETRTQHHNHRGGEVRIPSIKGALDLVEHLCPLTRSAALLFQLRKQILSHGVASGNELSVGSCQSCQLYMHCVDTYPQKASSNRHKFSSCRNMKQHFCGAYETLSACSAVKQLVRSCVKRTLQTLAVVGS